MDFAHTSWQSSTQRKCRQPSAILKLSDSGFHLPFGKLTVCYGKIHHFQLVNPRTKWPFFNSYVNKLPEGKWDSATGKSWKTAQSNVFTRFVPLRHSQLLGRFLAADLIGINAQPAQASHALLGRGRAILLPGPLPEQPLTQAVSWPPLHRLQSPSSPAGYQCNHSRSPAWAPGRNERIASWWKPMRVPSRQKRRKLSWTITWFINRILNAIFSIALRHLLKNLDVPIFPPTSSGESFSSSSGIGVEPLGMPRTLGADAKQPPAWQQSLHTLRLMRGSRGTGLVKGSSDQTGSVTNSMLCLLMAAVTTRHSWIPLWNRQLMTIDEKFCRNPRARNVICATNENGAKLCSFPWISMVCHGFPWFSMVSQLSGGWLHHVTPWWTVMTVPTLHTSVDFATRSPRRVAFWRNISTNSAYH